VDNHSRIPPWENLLYDKRRHTPLCTILRLRRALIRSLDENEGIVALLQGDCRAAKCGRRHFCVGKVMASYKSPTTSPHLNQSILTDAARQITPISTSAKPFNASCLTNIISSLFASSFSQLASVFGGFAVGA